MNHLDYSVQFEQGNYQVTLFGAASNVDLYVIQNGVSIRMAGGVAVTVNSTGSALNTEEHDQLMSLPDIQEILHTDAGCP